MADVGITSEVSFQYRDFSAEISRTKLHFQPLDDSADNSGLLGALGDIPVTGTLLNALTDCVEAGTTYSSKLDSGGAGLPVSVYAQRELAARMRYQDTVTGKFYRFDIPGPQPGLIQPGNDEVEMGDAAMVAFKVAFDANCVSPVGNAVELIDGRIVGRYS